MIFHLLYLLFALQFRNLCYLPPISLERTLQVLFGEDRKSMSGDYSSVLVILILHRFDLYSMFSLFFKKKKKLGEKMQGILFFRFLAYQILHVFFPDISVHDALIDYASI
jgi:hypothetical protein